MDMVSPIINIVSPVMNCGTKHVNYLCALDKKLKQLQVGMEQLNEIMNDVNNKVMVAEEQLMVRTSQVNGWMQRVAAKGREVDEILNEGEQHLERRCLNGCCPKNCWSSYKLGKKLVKKLIDVEEITRKGAFTTVAEYPPRAPGQEQPENFTVGLDLVFERALNLLGKDDVGFLGLYGVGGVGKTTLLKKINNELSKSNNGFDIIIWVVISSEVNIRTVQEAIRQRLGLMSWAVDVPLSSRANDIFTMLKMKKCLILLDDLWEEIDLQTIGIPRPNAQNKSKIVLTTRSLNVCGSMGAHDTIKVEFLNKDQSWNLFQEKVGQHTFGADSQIPKLAKNVVEKCHGLPLALITVGASMASKTNPREWQCAISDLNKCAAKFPGMEERVLHLLKFSYDKLPSHTEKVCFLFCALYPEDYQISIASLIEKWIGLGYIEGFEDYEEALNRGHSIVGALKRTCLLEKGRNDKYVKMHDVIRELALWISCECGREEGKVFVKSGKAFTELPMTDLRPTVLQTISLVETEFTHLERLPSCPNLSTFFALRHVTMHDQFLSMPDDFFLSMPALKFLDLSGNFRTIVPTSIWELVELEYLDLTHTDITSLPYEMRKLTKLKYLSVFSAPRLFRRFNCIIPGGIIKNFSNLVILKLIDQEGADIDELGCLNKLKVLDIRLSDFKDIEKFVSNPRLCNCARHLKFECEGCKEITFCTLSASPPPSSSSLSSHLCLGRFRELRKLEIHKSSKIKEWIFTNESESRLYESLEEMVIKNLPKLVISWDARNLHSGAHFRKLHRVNLDGCDKMVDLTWLLLIPNLQTLWVLNCGGLEEILSSSSDESGGVLYDLNTFSNLKELILHVLPNLRSICSISALPFPSLESIFVIECPNLRRLPLDSNSASNTLEKIRGEEEWWNELQWDNEAIKTQFTTKYLMSF